MARVGEQAPDFELPSTAGPIRLRELRARGRVVLAFYTEDRTPTCSSEIAALKNEYETLASLGAVVVGISSDDLDSHARFEEKLGGSTYRQDLCYCFCWRHAPSLEEGA